MISAFLHTSVSIRHVVIAVIISWGLGTTSWAQGTEKLTIRGKCPTIGSATTLRISTAA
jgi:hypothetical protein